MCSALKYVKKMILSGGCEQRKRYIPVLNRSVEAFYYNETTTIISTRNHNHEIWILDATFCRNFDNHAIPPALVKSPLENTQLPTAVILRSIAQMSGKALTV